jgi:hypothetical protein
MPQSHLILYLEQKNNDQLLLPWDSKDIKKYQK